MRDVFASQVVTRRKVLLWSHIAIALVVGLVLLSRENVHLSSLMVGRRMRGANGAVLALPAMWPYLLSLLASRRPVPQRSIYVVIYSLLLALAGFASVQVLLASDSLAGVTTIGIIEAVVLLFAVGLIGVHARGEA
jgi:hypothetical protein